jgi:putative transposase
LKPAQLKGLAQGLLDEYRVSMRKACSVVLLHRSMMYYAERKHDDKAIRMRMREIAQTRVRYGCERIFTLLRREGWKDNHKRIYRLYCLEGLNLRTKRHRRSRSGAHRLTRPLVHMINQCWSMDFMTDVLFNGKRFRVLTIVDNFSRKCHALEVGQSLKGMDVVQTMNRIKHQTGYVPERIQVDNGSEFISKDFDRWAYENNVTLDYSRPGRPTDNPFIESFNGSFRDECLNTNWFLSMEDAQSKVERFRRDYNEYRPHSSLQGLTPDQVESGFQNNPENSILALS